MCQRRLTPLPTFFPTAGHPFSGLGGLAHCFARFLRHIGRFRKRFFDGTLSLLFYGLGGCCLALAGRGLRRGCAFLSAAKRPRANSIDCPLDRLFAFCRRLPDKRPCHAADHRSNRPSDCPSYNGTRNSSGGLFRNCGKVFGSSGILCHIRHSAGDSMGTRKIGNVACRAV